jgi:pimeloyl-ACP methyl ester carboxylesterase
MSYTNADDLSLYYEEHGQGQPLVFLHGFSLDHRMWGPQAAVFRQKYRVILPDARGHGQSDSPQTGYSRTHRVEDLAGLVDNLGIERFHLVGLSMGGATAIGYALKFQERLKSLTLVSSGAAGYSASKKFSKLDDVARSDGVEAAKAKWMDWSLSWYREDRKEIGRLLALMMREFKGAIWSDPMRGKYPKMNDLDEVHKITVPTLIMAGDLDRMFAELASQLHERIVGSHSMIYKNTGHMLNLEQPEAFNRDLEVFLEGVS